MIFCYKLLLVLERVYWMLFIGIKISIRCEFKFIVLVIWDFICIEFVDWNVDYCKCLKKSYIWSVIKE